MKPTSIICSLLVVVAAGSTRAWADPPLQMRFEGDSIVVSEVNSGADVVYFSVHRFNDNFVPKTVRSDQVVNDDDGDGVVRIALDRAASGKFLAVAVELASGRFEVLMPESSPGREIALPANSLVRGPGGELDHLENDRRYVELFLVRPGVGAWGLTTGDGHPADESPSSDGLVRTSLSSLNPIGDSPAPPEEFEKDDLLFRVAPREMEYYAVRIVVDHE